MKEKTRLIKNFISLVILQGTNYLLPLLTLPYLVRVLGPEKFGLVAFAQAFIQYFILLTDYGFNLTATRQISIFRNDKKKLSEIISNVMTIKLLLMFSSLFIVCTIVFNIERFEKESFLYLITFGMVLGNVLFPVWFFQGMEKMKYITTFNLIAKIASTLSIFIFVTHSEDYYLVPLLNSLGFIVVGIVSLVLIFKKFDVKITMPTYLGIKYQLVDGWHVFISSISISLYTVSNTLILGLFTNNTIVGYYSAAEKLIKAFQGLIQPISQTIYPYINSIATNSKEKLLLFLSKIFKLIGLITAIISILIFLFAEKIVFILLGNEYSMSIIVVKIMSLIPFFTGLSNVLGIQTMLTLNFKKAYSRIIITASFFNLFLAIIIVPQYLHIGTAISVLSTEFLVVFAMFYYLNKKGINLITRKRILLEEQINEN